MEHHHFSSRVYSRIGEFDPCLLPMYKGDDVRYFKVSEIKHPLERYCGRCFGINFSVPKCFNSFDPVFEKFCAYGLDPDVVAGVCRLLVYAEHHMDEIADWNGQFCAERRTETVIKSVGWASFAEREKPFGRDQARSGVPRALCEP